MRCPHVARGTSRSNGAISSRWPIGSKTAPVAEVLTHGQTGLMVDFFDVQAWTDTLVETLANPGKYMALRGAARDYAIRNYDLRTVCLPRMVEFVESFGPEAA